MEDSQPQPTDKDEYIESLLQRGWSMQKAVNWRWGRVARHPTTHQLFELLKEHGEMSLAQIVSEMGKTRTRVEQIISPLRLTHIVEEERRGRFLYFRLRPGMIEQYQQYQQWLELHVQQSKKPLHLQLFELLSERGALDQQQITAALGISFATLDQVTAPLHKMGFINAKYQKPSQARFYCRIEPGMAEKYWRWYESQQPDEPEP